MSDAQRTAQKAKETSLLQRQEEAGRKVKEHCESLLLLADYRVLDSIDDINTPFIYDIAKALLVEHSKLSGINSKLDQVQGALYG